MCNTEFMVASSLYQMNAQEEIKELKREQIKDSYTRAMGAEEIREDAEQTKLTAWWDANRRTVTKKRGTAKTEMAGAGVEITAGADTDLMDSEWDSAERELAGQYAVIHTQQALLGDLRSVELSEVMEDRLEQYEKASILDWAFTVGTAIATGVMMEQKAGTWEFRESFMGLDKDQLPDWMTAGWTQWAPR